MYVYIKYIKGCAISLSELQIKYNIRYHSTYTRMIKIKIRANKSFSRSSLKFTSIKSVMPSSHLILCRPILPLPPIPPSIRVISKESALRMRWPKYWSFSFSIIPSKEHPGLIFFRMDWLDLLAVQWTLKSLFQHHSSKASILWHSAFFTVQLSHPYMTTGKTIALTRRTFVGKVLSLLLNMLSRLVINFLPRSKRLLISWLQSPSAVILEAKKIKSDTISTVSPSISHEVMGQDAMILVFTLVNSNLNYTAILLQVRLLYNFLHTSKLSSFPYSQLITFLLLYIITKTKAVRCQLLHLATTNSTNLFCN